MENKKAKNVNILTIQIIGVLIRNKGCELIERKHRSIQGQSIKEDLLQNLMIPYQQKLPK